MSRSSAKNTVPLKSKLTKGVYTDIDELLRLRFSAQDLSLASPKLSKASQGGSSRTRFRGRGMEFEEVRLYQPGDDIRSIDWRVTARTQVPHTKLFREERERPTFVVADQRSNLFFGSQHCFKSVLAARLATVIAWAALANSDRIGGLVFGNQLQKDIRPRRSKHALLELIHQLNTFNHELHSPLLRERKISLREMLEDTRRLSKPGSAVFVVSDFEDFESSCEEQLHLLARHTDVTLFHVSDPLEHSLPAGGALTVSDGNQRLQIASYDQNLRQDYQQQYEQKYEQLRQCCQKSNIALHPFLTSDDESLQLRNLYSKKLAASRHKRRA